MSLLQSQWTRTGVLTLLLLPLAGLFRIVASLRRQAYLRGVFKRVAVGVPVIVVGNITAGGSGKTPLVIWLVSWLRAQGYRPGIVSRGYGGSATGCVDVSADRAPGEVGDEPWLIRARTGAPVVIGRDRVAAARTLLAHYPGVDVVVADDGLQHYRLHRDIELAVVDAATGLGNGWPLPAGPLREPRRRLQSVDAVIQVERTAGTQPLIEPRAWRVHYAIDRACRLRAPETSCRLRDLPAQVWLAASGIGRPQGFFDMLTAQGLNFTARAFPDHHGFRPDDLPADGAVLMTEKDAVKCTAFAGADWWSVPLDVSPESGFIDWLTARLRHAQGVVGEQHG